MATVKQKVYLITEQQREGLLNYLLNRPYREVAAGVQFLTDAPTTILNVELPEESATLNGEEASQSAPEQEPKLLEIVPSSSEELVLSHA
jgi:secreted PhoX family phosphatase